MNKIEMVKDYICEQIRERGFENNQIKIDFADICEEEETIQAAKELGLETVPGKGQGVWWIYIEEVNMKIYDITEVDGRIFAIIIDNENMKAYEALLVNGKWDTDFSYPSINVNSFDVAEALDFDGAKKAGYNFD